MAETQDPILIKRYASRRLYNTETSDYVTLEEVADFIREGKDIKIVDRKTGEDITRQYLLQIIADQESRGETVLPINVLTDIVRAYSTNAENFVPAFLSQSFQMLKDSQAKFLGGLNPNGMQPFDPMQPMAGFENWRKMQSEYLSNMMGSFGQQTQTEDEDENEPSEQEREDEIAAIKRQLSELQNKLKNL